MATQESCCVCLTNEFRMRDLNCNHPLCKLCYLQMHKNNIVKCPICRSCIQNKVDWLEKNDLNFAIWKNNIQFVHIQFNHKKYQKYSKILNETEFWATAHLKGIESHNFKCMNELNYSFRRFQIHLFFKNKKSVVWRENKF